MPELCHPTQWWQNVPAPKFNNITKIEQPKDLQDESEKLNFGRDYQLTL